MSVHTAVEPMLRPGEPEPNYLTNGNTISSWLLTKDHKRIAVLYLVSITLLFALGGIAAGVIRAELTAPTGHFIASETYNKMFTMHGVLMVFFFLVPSIPATLGNFFVPMMIGAKDLAFPKINLASWYIFVIAGVFVMYSLAAGGVDTGWTFYTPFSSVYSNTHVVSAALGV